MIISILLFLSSVFSFLQKPIESTDRWLVELKSDDDACLTAWWEGNGFTKAGYVKKALPFDHWWVVEIPSHLSTSFRQLPCLLRTMEDRKIDWRDTQPNDPAYINQSDMNLIGMPKAWDVATGGLTAQGNTIVVALIDNGYQIDHEDLVGNLWVNSEEIPGDGLDNDQNGYVDDYRGLNVALGTDAHPVASHGTSVCGIIGAKGNNNIGVTGVNWNIKMMLISQANFESTLIESYQYVLDMRKKYRQTNGAKGAFVVATNLSGGVDFAMAADHPLWCDMYNKLGQEGILSIAAAPNKSISVDLEGDMPTTCTSPYLITVTNVDLSDALVGNAGFGPVSIDLGAPGNGTITIASGNQYKEFPGTSSAAPHVAGAVALMYSTPCPSFLFDVKSDPQATAGRIRDILLSTAKANAALNQITATGKRVQVNAAMNATVMDCGEIPSGGINIFSVQPNPARLENVEVFFEVQGDTSTAFFELYTSSGARVYQIPLSAEQFAQGSIQLNTHMLPPGIYLLTLRNQKEKVTRKLFVY